MGLIHRLPHHIQNQIAAGEVVERPASVVKELLENALDAGAQSVRVDLEAAGRRLIRIVDDGAGMSSDDARLAVEKHTTSKLRSEKDLWNLNTLGFRGEALASIASISCLELVTAGGDASSGCMIRMNASDVIEELPAPPVRGTTVTVRDLFFNTPARRKFLKTDATELYHCLETVIQHALVNPSVAFVVNHNGRQVLNAPAVGEALDRIRDLFGREFVEHMKEIEAPENGPVGVHGFVSLRDHHASRRQQYLFVNGRPVRHASISQALYTATSGFRPEGRHPVYIVFIRVSPDAVDVNIHPTKREVRFTDNAVVVQALQAALRELRGLAPFRPGTKQHAVNASTVAPPAATPVYFDRQPAFLQIHDRQESYGQIGSPRPESVPRRFLNFGGTYFAHADDDGITLVDQHAAHERVLYELFLKGSCPTSPLLVPRRMDFSAAEFQLLLNAQQVFSELGFVFEPFGTQSILLREIPSELVGKEYTTILADTLTRLLEDRRADRHLVRKDVAALMACHEAVRAGDVLKDQDLEHLLFRLEACEEPNQCPHGRPTRIRLSGAELMKLFKRS